MSADPPPASDAGSLHLHLDGDVLDALDAFRAAQTPPLSRIEAAAGLLQRALAHVGHAPAAPMRKLIKGQYTRRRKGEAAPAETPVSAAIGDFLADAQSAARDMARTSARAGKNKAATILNELADAYDGVAPTRARSKRVRGKDEPAAGRAGPPWPGPRKV